MERFILDMGIVDGPIARSVVHRYLRSLYLAELQINLPGAELIGFLAVACNAVKMENLPRHRMAA